MSSKRHVLIVEDEQDIVEMLTNDLEGDYDIVSAYNGEDGLQMLLEHTPDIILLDLKMEPMSGYQFIEEIERRCLPQVPILLMTAFADVQQTAVDLLQHNERVYNLIPKPFRYIEYVESEIEKAIQNAQQAQ